MNDKIKGYCPDWLNDIIGQKELEILYTKWQTSNSVDPFGLFDTFTRLNVGYQYIRSDSLGKAFLINSRDKTILLHVTINDFKALTNSNISDYKKGLIV